MPGLQFEKRVREQDGTDPIQRCRLVLQRALVANPQNAKICQVPTSLAQISCGLLVGSAVCLTRACALQAWGLMELQRGNLLASLILLERCVSCDPDLSPVLRCPLQPALWLKSACQHSSSPVETAAE